MRVSKCYEENAALQLKWNKTQVQVGELIREKIQFTFTKRKTSVLLKLKALDYLVDT